MKFSRSVYHLISVGMAAIVLLGILGACATTQNTPAAPTPAPTQRATLPPLPKCLASTGAPRCYSPQQIRQAYQIQPLLDTGITGKGRTIVLIEVANSPTLNMDVHLYDQIFGLKDPKIATFIASQTPPGSDFIASEETTLDVEIAHALAPDAAIDLVMVDVSRSKSWDGYTLNILGGMKYAVNQNLGDVIEQVFGTGEDCVDATYLQEEHQILQEAQAKHITVLASTGDAGAAVLHCPNGPQAPRSSTLPFIRGVSLPASDPLVTAIGGSSLNATVKTGDYIGETTWNDHRPGTLSFAYSTGGGFSALFPRPAYQQGVTGTGTMRGIPDVAFDADPFTGIPIVYSPKGKTMITPVGGTSVCAPVWAAIVALADQFANKRLGFLNDALYRIGQSGSYAQAFHDVTTGNNTVTIQNQGKQPSMISGYNAGPGWDAVTGLGTPNVASLVHLLAQEVNS